jgi:hypothetical protein
VNILILSLSQPAAKVLLRAERTADQGQTGTVNDQAKCGQLRPFTGSHLRR